MNHTAIVQTTKASGSRSYEIDGELFPSVTTILATLNKPFLVPWAAKLERELVIKAAAELEQSLPVNAPTMSVPAYEATLTKRLPKKKAHALLLEERSAIGSMVHDAIETQCRLDLCQVVPELPPLNKPEVATALGNYRTWKEKFSFKPKLVEEIVYSKEYGYAGTTDWVGTTTYAGNPMVTIGDWKTGKALYPEQRLQVAAYAMALCEMGHTEPAIRGAVVRVPWMQREEPETLWLSWPEIEEAFIAFLALKRVYDYFQKV